MRRHLLNQNSRLQPLFFSFLKQVAGLLFINKTVAQVPLMDSHNNTLYYIKLLRERSKLSMDTTPYFWLEEKKKTFLSGFFIDVWMYYENNPENQRSSSRNIFRLP